MSFFLLHVYMLFVMHITNSLPLTDKHHVGEEFHKRSPRFICASGDFKETWEAHLSSHIGFGFLVCRPGAQASFILAKLDLGVRRVSGNMAPVTPQWPCNINGDALNVNLLTVQPRSSRLSGFLLDERVRVVNARKWNQTRRLVE